MIDCEIIKLSKAGNRLFPGHTLFNLKTTHGLPLDFALDQIQDKGLTVDWVGFIEEARKNKWWDFQTYEVITHALEDAMFPKPYIEGVKARFQAYVLANPLVS